MGNVYFFSCLDMEIEHLRQFQRMQMIQINMHRIGR